MKRVLLSILIMLSVTLFSNSVNLDDTPYVDGNISLMVWSSGEVKMTFDNFSESVYYDISGVNEIIDRITLAQELAVVESGDGFKFNHDTHNVISLYRRTSLALKFIRSDSNTSVFINVHDLKTDILILRVKLTMEELSVLKTNLISCQANINTMKDLTKTFRKVITDH